MDADVSQLVSQELQSWSASWCRKGDPGWLTDGDGVADSEVQMGFLSLGTPTASKLPPELGDLFLSSAACWEESLFALLLMIPIEHRIHPPYLGFPGSSAGKESALLPRGEGVREGLLCDVEAEYLFSRRIRERNHVEPDSCWGGEE